MHYALSPDVLMEIDLRVRSGLHNLEEVFYIVGSHMELPQEVEHLLDADPAILNDLAAAIDAAFARMAGAGEHVERLAELARRLRGRGIVSVFGRGGTQADARQLAAHRAFGLFENGPDQGYATCSQQDVWSCLERGVLWVAFGGWTDSDTDSARVGRTIVDLAHEVGLTAQWSGAVRERIQLTSFAWDPVPVAMDQAKLASFVDDWRAIVAALQVGPDAWMRLLEQTANQTFEGVHGFSKAWMQRVMEAGVAVLDEAVQGEASWTEPTANDRLSAALAALATHGIVAIETDGPTLLDAWANTLNSHGAVGGAVFTSAEDALDAVAGQPLRLAFGVGSPDATPAQHGQVAATAVAVLRDNGIDATWSGDPTRRIEIAPMRWRRRRWSAPPLVPRPTPLPPTRPVLALEAPFAPTEPSFFTAAQTEACVPPAWSRRLRAAAGPGAQAARYGLPIGYLRTGVEHALRAAPATLNPLDEMAAVCRRVLGA